MTAASVLAAALVACGSPTGGGSTGTPRADLLALARIDSANPTSPVVFQVRNSQISTVTIRHSDASQTVFAQLTFIHSIASANGVIPCDTCAVGLSVTLTPGSYEVTIGPSAVVFALSSSPTLAVSYGAFGDLSVYTQSARYASAAAYGQALQLWRERASDRWVLGRNSDHTGASQITSALDAPGRYLIAAPR